MKGRPRQSIPRRREGTVLVLVLAFVVLLTFIVTAFLEDATAKIKYYGLFHNRDDLRVDAYSALESSLAVLSMYREVEEALWGPSQGWGDPLATTDFEPQNAGSVRVEYTDESGRLPLHSLEYADLLILFELLDFSLPDREALADGFLDWTDEDNDRRLNGFDGDDYEDFEPPYLPANGPVETFDEFRLIRPFDELFFDEKGNPLPEWNRFRSSVSLYNEGPVNINAAPPLVIQFLTEKRLLDPYGLDRYKSGVDGEPGTEDDRLLTGEDQGILLEGAGEYASTEASLLRVKSIASRGQARFEVEVLVEWVGASPGLGAGGSRDEGGEETEEDNDPPAPRDIRRRSGGARSGAEVQTELPDAGDLGYPFKVLRLLENRKF